MIDVYKYWDAALKQDADAMRKFFEKDAVINWHCTNERFTVEEFIQANCTYPGKWGGGIERLERLGDLFIAAVKVEGEGVCFHAVSFMQTNGDRITGIDEYWGEDGAAPEWRLKKRIGTKIK